MTRRLTGAIGPALFHEMELAFNAYFRDTPWLVGDAISRAPVLLTNADYYGTLAATRALGEQGIPVYIATDRILAASRWSRHVTRSFTCPPVEEAARFVDWLADFGSQEPEVVLYPTSDETAFLYALHHERLARSFLMYQAPLDALLQVLDKRRLYTTARAVGLEVPETLFPCSEEDVERAAAEVPMPVLLKPRTQVLSVTHSKGLIVREPRELLPKYREFLRGSRYGSAVLSHIPEAAQPMIQRFVPNASKQIYVLAAFADRSGELFVARAGMKVFQRPRTLGIGLCFEDAPIHPEVSEGVRRLVRATGYFGVLQLEFIEEGGRHLLIDYNPRLYNQLAFDIARGLPLPQIVHAAACGRQDELRSLVRSGNEASRSPARGPNLVFCNEFGMRFMLHAQRIAGSMSLDEARYWDLWRSRHADGMVDPAIAAGDSVPALVDAAAQLYAYARHPRAFLRKIVLDHSAA
jgi:D-aspartate ligase